MFLESETLLLRPLSRNDFDKIKAINYSKALDEFGASGTTDYELTDNF